MKHHGKKVACAHSSAWCGPNLSPDAGGRAAVGPHAAGSRGAAGPKHRWAGEVLRLIFELYRSICTTSYACLNCRTASAMFDSVFDCEPQHVRDTNTQILTANPQADAKKAVANALRNRWRRHKLGSPMRVRQLVQNHVACTRLQCLRL